MVQRRFYVILGGTAAEAAIRFFQFGAPVSDGAVSDTRDCRFVSGPTD